MACDRYESEGLTGFPPTPSLREHLASCPDCQRAEHSYVRLQQLLPVAGGHASPAEGWQQRINVRLAQNVPRRFPLRAVVAGAAAIAASVALFFLLPSRRTAVPLASIETELISSTQMRAATAAVGSTWKVTVDAQREVRVWRNQDTLVLRCPAGGCEVRGTRQVATVPLTAAGEYRVMVLTPGAAPLAAPVSFDEDARLAREAGATYEVVEPIVVF